MSVIGHHSLAERPLGAFCPPRANILCLTSRPPAPFCPPSQVAERISGEVLAGEGVPAALREAVEAQLHL